VQFQVEGDRVVRLIRRGELRRWGGRRDQWCGRVEELV
jgi:hypothetical protein